MFIIDRFEGEWAIVENSDRKTFTLPRSLCENSHEGDVIIIQVSVNHEATLERKSKVTKLLDHFFDQ